MSVAQRFRSNESVMQASNFDKILRKNQSSTDNYINKISGIRARASTTIEDSRRTQRQRKHRRRSNSLMVSSVDQQAMIQSSVRNAKKRSELYKFRILINKKKEDHGLSKSDIPKKNHNSFEDQHHYKQIYYNQIINKRQANQIDQKDEDNQIVFSPDKLNRIKIKNTNLRKQIRKQKIIEPIFNQFTEEFQLLAEETQPKLEQTPGKLIYNHFSNKYRDYTTMKKRQLENATDKFKHFFNQQNKILNHMIKKGVSQQNQFKMISQIYKTYLLMNGRIKQFETPEKFANVNTIKKIRNKK